MGRLHGSPDVLQTLLVAPPSWFQDGGAGNDVNQDLGRPFRSPLRRGRKMAALPLPAAILDDLISGSENEVIQDGGRKWKGRHLAPPQWGSKRSPYTTVNHPENNMDLNQGLLHIWSKFRDLSLNGWWVIARTSKCLPHTQTDGRTDT